MANINNVLVEVYRRIPKKVLTKIGKFQLLKRLRDGLLRRGTTYKEVVVDILKNYEGKEVAFKFVASIKVAASAKSTGIETKLLNNSIKLIERYKKNNSTLTILDIGSNVGYLSFVWSKTIAKNGKIYAFEPNINVNHSFNKAIKLNYMEDIIHLEQFAVGKESKTINLYLNNTTSNTINTEISKSCKEVQMIHVDGYFKQHPIKQCDLIKIDVDGIEFDILIGSIDTIKTFQPILIIETNDDSRIIDYFKPLNYAVLDMNLQVYDGKKPLPLNIFCIPNEATL